MLPLQAPLSAESEATAHALIRSRVQALASALAHAHGIAVHQETAPAAATAVSQEDGPAGTQAATDGPFLHFVAVYKEGLTAICQHTLSLLLPA